MRRTERLTHTPSLSSRSRKVETCARAQSVSTGWPSANLRGQVLFLAREMRGASRRPQRASRVRLGLFVKV
jgi:hypothetical protein